MITDPRTDPQAGDWLRKATRRGKRVTKWRVRIVVIREDNMTIRGKYNSEYGDVFFHELEVSERNGRATQVWSSCYHLVSLAVWRRWAGNAEVYSKKQLVNSMREDTRTAGRACW